MDKLALLYRVPSPHSIYNMLRDELAGCDTILDVGCGEDSILLRLGFNHARITGLDIWERYAIKHKDDAKYEGYLLADVTKIDLPAKSYDMVFLSDTLEHLSKEDVYNSNLFEKMSRWAKKKVVMMLPCGFIYNGSYDGNPYLYHKSGWDVGELRREGFKVRCTVRVRRKKYFKLTLLETVRTMFAVKEV